MLIIGYVEYSKRCVKGNNGKCGVNETASNSQGLDTPSRPNGNVQYRSRRAGISLLGL